MPEVKTYNKFHCFICGSELEEVGLGWLQCKSEECGEVFLPYKDTLDHQCMMLQQTPFTPVFNG